MDAFLELRTMSTPEDDSAVKKPAEDATPIAESAMTNGDEAGKDVSVDKAAQEFQAEEQHAGSKQPGDEKAANEEKLASETGPSENKSTKER